MSIPTRNPVSVYAHMPVWNDECMARRESVTGPGMEEEAEFVRAMKRLRDERGWTQADLAKKMTEMGWSGIYQTTISRIESGDRPVRIGEARGIAKTFGVTVGLMLAKPESSKPVEALKNSVLRLDDLTLRLREDIEDHYVFSRMILPKEMDDVRESGYSDWADVDMKASIELFLRRAQRHVDTSIGDLVDDVMEQRNAEAEATIESVERAQRFLASEDHGVDN